MTGSRTYRSQNVESMDLESTLLGREGLNHARRWPILPSPTGKWPLPA